MATIHAGRFGSIQVLRALAANMVVAAHFVELSTRTDPAFRAWEPAFATIGVSGVHCFFVISGFVIARVAVQESWSRFLVLRLTRIYPIYWLYLALTVTFYAAKGWTAPTPSLLNSILLLPDSHGTLVPVAWSLIHEIYFYLVMTAFIVLRVPLALALFGWAAFIVGANILGMGDHIATHVYTLEFIAGAGLTLLPRYRIGWVMIAMGFAFVAMGIGFSIFYRPSAAWLQMLLIGVAFIPVVYGAVSITAPVPKLLEDIGDASYSTYLSHFLLLAALTRALSLLPFNSVASNILAAIVCIVAANAWGLFSYRYFERPIIDLARTSFSKKSQHLDIPTAG